MQKVFARRLRVPAEARRDQAKRTGRRRMRRPAGDAEKRCWCTRTSWLVSPESWIRRARAVYCRLISCNKKDLSDLSALARDTLVCDKFRAVQRIRANCAIAGICDAIGQVVLADWILRTCGFLQSVRRSRRASLQLVLGNARRKVIEFLSCKCFSSLI